MQGHPANPGRVRLGAVALAVAGILFFLYPSIRPFSDEASLQGAAAFGSTAWIVAHMMAMVAFTMLMLGLLGLYSALQKTPPERLAFWTIVVGIVGVGLTLPFYGGEAFGLHAIGQEALRQHSSSLVGLASEVRSGPQLIMFLLGLLLVAVAAIMAAIVIWRSGVFRKWSGVPFAIAFALYIPQFFGTQPIRVAHGLLVTVGCLWIAVELMGKPVPAGRR
jgi:hypothetical protein